MEGRFPPPPPPPPPRLSKKLKTNNYMSSRHRRTCCGSKLLARQITTCTHIFATCTTFWLTKLLNVPFRSNSTVVNIMALSKKAYGRFKTYVGTLLLHEAACLGTFPVPRKPPRSREPQWIVPEGLTLHWYVYAYFMYVNFNTLTSLFTWDPMNVPPW